jgi:DNA-binding transcriptional LysR family regulator
MNRAAIHELECFVAVAEELNFSRAARRLHLSQPPLSRQIRALENKLGLRLLERNTRAVSLTPAGALYLEDARAILTRVDSAADSAKRAVTGEAVRLRLAFVGALLDEGLVRLLQSFRRRHPHCQIHLTDLSPADQLEALRGNHVDGAFIGAAPSKPIKGISTTIWKREPLLIALPECHPLAEREKLSLTHLTAESWVMVSRAAAPAFRKQFDALCASAKFRPKVVQESDRVAAVLTMIAAEQGISLLPKALAKVVPAGVSFREIAGKRILLDHAFAFRSANNIAVVGHFLHLLRQAFHKS